MGAKSCHAQDGFLRKLRKELTFPSTMKAGWLHISYLGKKSIHLMVLNCACRLQAIDYPEENVTMFLLNKSVCKQIPAKFNFAELYI